MSKPSNNRSVLSRYVKAEMKVRGKVDVVTIEYKRTRNLKGRLVKEKVNYVCIKDIEIESKQGKIFKFNHMWIPVGYKVGDVLAQNRGSTVEAIGEVYQYIKGYKGSVTTQKEDSRNWSIKYGVKSLRNIKFEI